MRCRQRLGQTYEEAEFRVECWVYRRCGREAGGANVATLGVCPAYPDHGQHCARITGTLCGGKVQGTFATKLANCLDCGFYNSADYDQAYRG